MDACNKGERGVSTSVFHDESDESFLLKIIRVDSISGCHGRPGSLACFESCDFSLTGTLKSWGKRQPLSWTRKNNTEDHESTHPRSFARRNSLISPTALYHIQHASIPPLVALLAGWDELTFINKHGRRCGRRVQYPSHRPRAPFYHPRGCPACAD